MKIVLQKGYFEILGSEGEKVVCNLPSLSEDQMDKIATSLIRAIGKELYPEKTLPGRASRQALLDRLKEKNE